MKFYIPYSSSVTFYDRGVFTWLATEGDLIKRLLSRVTSKIKHSDWLKLTPRDMQHPIIMPYFRVDTTIFAKSAKSGMVISTGPFVNLRTFFCQIFLMDIECIMINNISSCCQRYP